MTHRTMPLLAEVALLVLAVDVSAQVQFTPPQPLTPAVFVETYRLNIAGDGHGRWIAVWPSFGTADTGPDGNISMSRTSDSSETWSPPLVLNTDAATEDREEQYAEIATDHRGTWIAVWNASLSDSGIYTSRSLDHGATWSDPSLVNIGAGTLYPPGYRPQIGTDGRGTWVVVWEVADTIGSAAGPDGDFMFSRSTDRGSSWSAPAFLNSDATSDARLDAEVQLVTDRNGTWVAAWLANEDIGGTGDNDIWFSRSVDAGQTWSTPRLLNTNGDIDSGSDASVSLAGDPNGTWVAVWHSNENLVNPGVSDLDILFSRSLDSGQTWTAPQLLNNNGGTGFDGSPRVATNNYGHWIVVWASTDSLGGAIGEDWDILFSESQDAGVTWTEPALLDPVRATDGEYDDEQLPQIVSDGSSTWIAGWVEGESPPERGFIANPRYFIATTQIAVPADSDSDGTLCFIATAAFGTPLAPELEKLRLFRNSWLLSSPATTTLVDGYYRLSPPAADWIAQRPVVRRLVRIALAPLVFRPMEAAALTLVVALLVAVTVFATRRDPKLTVRTFGATQSLEIETARPRSAIHDCDRDETPGL